MASPQIIQDIENQYYEIKATIQFQISPFCPSSVIAYQALHQLFAGLIDSIEDAADPHELMRWTITRAQRMITYHRETSLLPPPELPTSAARPVFIFHAQHPQQTGTVDISAVCPYHLSSKGISTKEVVCWGMSMEGGFLCVDMIHICKDYWHKERHCPYGNRDTDNTGEGILHYHKGTTIKVAHIKPTCSAVKNKNKNKTKCESKDKGRCEWGHDDEATRKRAAALTEQNIRLLEDAKRVYADLTYGPGTRGLRTA